MSPVANLTAVDQALERILEETRTQRITETELVLLEQAGGRVLAQTQPVPMDVPPADNSAVDGYAIRLEDLSAAPIPVSQRIAAGDAPQPLQPGTAARIFTGAAVPEGADTVLMQEKVTVTESGLTTEQTPEAGQNIRPCGQDLKEGDTALEAGTRLRPQELGLLASIGIAKVSVIRRPRVAILTTGDELVTPGKPLPPGSIYNTNRYTFLALLRAMDCDIVETGNVADTLDATRAALEKAAEDADLILSSGGVSVGDEDHVRIAMEQLGTVDLWRLAIKPGKPLASGWIGNTPMLGLPGNPAAVLVTFLAVAAPVIRQMRGEQPVQPTACYLPAGFSHDKAALRREYLRARLQTGNGQTRVIPHPNQSSGMLSSACWADGLAVIPEETRVHEGDLVAYYPFSELLR